MTAKIYTVPLGAPFLPTLANAIFRGGLLADASGTNGKLTVSDITLLLPTRRAARAAEAAFLRASGEAALIMPAIRPISSGDEDQSLIAGLAAGAAIDSASAEALLAMPPAIEPLHRIVVLMQYVSRWHQAQSKIGATQKPLTLAQAANLSADLATLMDGVEREGVSLDGLTRLVPDEYSEHWRATVEFLKIVTETFPNYLKAADRIAPAARTNALIMEEARRLATYDDDKPVIVAGVTGSIPATVDLMQAVLQRARGAVVLPGLDLHLDEESWQRIVPNHPEHPQFGLSKLLNRLGVARDDVIMLPHDAPARIADDRAVLFSEALRPSVTTAKWRSFTEQADRTKMAAALQGLAIVTTPSAHDEAEAVALILREAVETPGRTAALVSPDRILARRVAIRLRSLGIRVDDSAGRPFVKTVPGTFLNLVIDAAATDFAPAETMALLKHPLCRLGLGAFDMRRAARALEIIAFRRPYLGQGIDGVIAALEAQSKSDERGEREHVAARRLWADDRDAALNAAMLMRDAFAPLTELYRDGVAKPFKAFIVAHARVAEAIAARGGDGDGDGDSDGKAAVNPMWVGHAGEAAALLLSAMQSDDVIDFAVPSHEYRELFLSLVARENVREGPDVHPRVAIWGPMEARLQQPDVVVLGSLNEGTWPRVADPGAWLNRPMRNGLGLPQPEEDIGRSALDFATQLGASQVYLTRAEKVKGVPTVPSRWLMRLEAVLAGLGLKDAINADNRWASWARARDSIDPQAANAAPPLPAPTPPVALRPRKLSVTAIEAWVRNPYAIFARYILSLDPLPPLGSEPDASSRGALVHGVLSEFAKAHPDTLPENIEAELSRIAERTLEAYSGSARIAAFWMPRLTRFLQWFAETEPDRRAATARCVAETSGMLVIDAPAGPFTLTARADRIDAGNDHIVITDYKTGAVPSDKKVKSGQSPQLPLEAAIAASESGFPGISPAATSALRYIRASGGEPAGEETVVKCDDVAALSQSAVDGLAELIAHFDDPSTPYQAVRRPGFRYDYDDFAHLARVAEWSAHSDSDSEGES